MLFDLNKAANQEDFRSWPKSSPKVMAFQMTADNFADMQKETLSDLQNMINTLKIVFISYSARLKAILAKTKYNFTNLCFCSILSLYLNQTF